MDEFLRQELERAYALDDEAKALCEKNERERAKCS
jgi:hypothetical protein